MARSRKGPLAGTAAAILAGLLLGIPAQAQNAGAPAPAAPPPAAAVPSPYSRDCQTGGTTIVRESPLPNVTAALKSGKTLRILAIGASATGRRGTARGGFTGLIEQLLERGKKGLDVVMIDRGYSGELAAKAERRIKNEVALTEPELVLWQVGTNDALAYVPLDEFEATVTNTVRWLKAHKVDVVLAGLQYVDRVAQDAHYKSIRDALRKIAAEENVVIVRRYEAMQFLAKAGADRPGYSPDEFERTEAGYDCLAQYVARAITLGAFGKTMPQRELRRTAPATAPEPAPAK